MLGHIRLLVFDLDYLIFDCAKLKIRALRESLISFAEALPHCARLPDAIDVEEGFLDHGFRWLQFLEMGLDEEGLASLQSVYRIQEGRLIDAGTGGMYPGMREFLATCRCEEVRLALGAEASRDYLLAVSDRHELDNLFDVTLCTEEYGVGSTDEMLKEIMQLATVNPSETLVLGTRPSFFQAAHNVDVLTIGCGWGIQKRERLAEADLQSLTLAQILTVLQKADELATQYLA